MQTIRSRLFSHAVRHGSRMFPELQRGRYNRLERRDGTVLEGIVSSKGVSLLLKNYDNLTNI